MYSGVLIGDLSGVLSVIRIPDVILANLYFPFYMYNIWQEEIMFKSKSFIWICVNLLKHV
jgi:hypothetical protein